MPQATLLVVNGPNRGARFEIKRTGRELFVGRSVGTQIRVDDTEVSRQHAKVFYDGSVFRLVDLRSANGTYVNGRRVNDVALRDGDSIRLGTTVLAFQLTETERQPTQVEQVRFVDDSPSGQHSAIVQQVRVDSVSSSGSSVNQQAVGLELLYQVAEELVRPTHTLESLLDRIVDLTLNAVLADRGCVLLREAVGAELTPLVYRQRGSLRDPSEKMLISRSITGYVIQNGQAVRTSDALHDQRFGGGHSIASSGIREAICAPLRGHGDLLGVLYIDITTDVLESDATGVTGRLTEAHLKSVVAVARQAAMAIESRRYQEALLKAERFAAMGQTIAVLSHHIKNILQGVRGGGYLIQRGLDTEQNEMVRQGWHVVEKNQNRIYDLVMDMLSFSKERVPNLQAGNLNRVCEDVAELAMVTATENGVRFEFRPAADVPQGAFDHEGIHRAVLNIVVNALDAVAELEDGLVVLQTGYDSHNDIMLVAVTDNGPGIPEEQRATVFNVFESSKGARGTGIGLPVSRKIIREHGGRIRIEGGPGEGTRFVLSWPRGTPSPETICLDRPTNVSEEGSSVQGLRP
ncbi:MAG: FHA domain-containing protein [Planctomycetaceae bacterium]|nr:FHA domain-containing protein [Planctomycetaceae bacterium]